MHRRSRKFFVHLQNIVLLHHHNQICICWTQVGGDVNINFNIVVYDDNGPGGQPGTLIASIPVTANGVPTFPNVAFYDFNVTGLIPPINSGSVYIGARWAPMVEQNFFICADESPTTPLYPITCTGSD